MSPLTPHSDMRSQDGCRPLSGVKRTFVPKFAMTHNMQMEELAKETVVIVHGTWAAPEPDKTQWYQQPDSASATEGFVSKLDAALRERGSLARCWAHCTT